MKVELNIKEIKIASISEWFAKSKSGDMAQVVKGHVTGVVIRNSNYVYIIVDDGTIDHWSDPESIKSLFVTPLSPGDSITITNSPTDKS